MSWCKHIIFDGYFALEKNNKKIWFVISVISRKENKEGGIW